MGRRRKSKSKPEKSAAAASAAAPPPWIELPSDLTANILQRLGAEEILHSAQKVCTTWRRVCQDPAMWRVVVLKNPCDMYMECGGMCRHAVDRSQGQLTDLTLDYFGDDELLNYVADRSSHLKRLRLDSCYDISGEGLAEAVKKLTHLEELHLTIMPSVSAVDVENIGTSCPMLKSFTFNERGSKHPHPHPEFPDDVEFVEGFGYNDYALAIAKTMPNLRHLRLFAHWMKNEGLQAILDGCPHLESLDLRQCFDLDLGGDLGKRCSQQIKDLKRPSDSTSDIYWLVNDPSVGWGADHLSDCGFSDVYSYGSFDNFGYYDDFEYYDDYTSPLGIGFFGDDGSWFFDDDYF